MCAWFLPLFFFFNIYLAVPGLSCSRRDLSCTMQDLVPWPGVEPGSPALEARSLNHWTIREVPGFYFWVSLKTERGNWISYSEKWTSSWYITKSQNLEVSTYGLRKGKKKKKKTFEGHKLGWGKGKLFFPCKFEVLKLDYSVWNL